MLSPQDGENAVLYQHFIVKEFAKRVCLKFAFETAPSLLTKYVFKIAIGKLNKSDNQKAPSGRGLREAVEENAV